MYIFGEITEKTAEEVIRQLHEEKLHEIWLYSNGGDLMAALAIYDAIVGKGIKVIGTGYVASSGVVILLAGDERYSTRNTRFMTHEVRLVIPEGNEPSETQSGELAAFNLIITDMIVERTNVTRERAAELLTSDHNFNMKAAIEMGFVHKEWGG